MLARHIARALEDRISICRGVVESERVTFAVDFAMANAKTIMIPRSVPKTKAKAAMKKAMQKPLEKPMVKPQVVAKTMKKQTVAAKAMKKSRW